MERCNWKVLSDKFDTRTAVVFGASKAMSLAQHIEGYFQNEVFCDNSTDLIGTNVYGHSVVSVSEAIKIKDAIFLIPLSRSTDEKKKQLNDLGIDDSVIFCPYEMEIPLKKLQFEVHVADHCNLNCKCCNHMAPLANENYVDIQKLEESYKRLSMLSRGGVDHIHLLGGEPLLNPEISRIVRMTREYFPIGSINIITNGLLLSRMDDNFWYSLNKYKVRILYTEYPIQLNYQKIVHEIRDKHVEIQSIGSITDFQCVPKTHISDRSKEYNFRHCHEGGNNCIQLRDGKLYPCAPAAYIEFLNTKLKTEKFESSPQDGVDIYEVNTLEELMEKLSNPVPFCKYCDEDNIRKEKWEQGNDPGYWLE